MKNGYTSFLTSFAISTWIKLEDLYFAGQSDASGLEGRFPAFTSGASTNARKTKCSGKFAAEPRNLKKIKKKNVKKSERVQP